MTGVSGPPRIAVVMIARNRADEAVAAGRNIGVRLTEAPFVAF